MTALHLKNAFILCFAHIPGIITCYIQQLQMAVSLSVILVHPVCRLLSLMHVRTVNCSAQSADSVLLVCGWTKLSTGLSLDVTWDVKGSHWLAVQCMFQGCIYTSYSLPNPPFTPLHLHYIAIHNEVLLIKIKNLKKK